MVGMKHPILQLATEAWLLGWEIESGVLNIESYAPLFLTSQHRPRTHHRSTNVQKRMVTLEYLDSRLEQTLCSESIRNPCSGSGLLLAGIWLENESLKCSLVPPLVDHLDKTVDPLAPKSPFDGFGNLFP